MRRRKPTPKEQAKRQLDRDRGYSDPEWRPGLTSVDRQLEARTRKWLAAHDPAQSARVVKGQPEAERSDP